MTTACTKRRGAISEEVHSPRRSDLRGDPISEEIRSPRTLHEDSSTNLRRIFEEGAGARGGGACRCSFYYRSGLLRQLEPHGKMQTWHGRGVTLLPPEAMDRKVMMMGPSPKGVLSEGGDISSRSLSRGELRLGPTSLVTRSLWEAQWGVMEGAGQGGTAVSEPWAPSRALTSQ